ncbi:Heavy metal-associated isoprenylated plant protein 26 [Apostasia shenzhenica]|uniref:Heavy metal-associated isoprenylated plant protein 26 n=1 Tax=Apostasia shenzhenica TaxID=1088818 RepID=A0A2I0B3C2_9ASPA|nr:Heavy metal-associated isoprenylated plant protein 26 [Apostasia shenzhenica]
MSKEDDTRLLKIQNCVLKVNIHCDGCKQKVKKLLQKIDGVYQTAIDAEQGKVTVSGNVDPATLIKKLNKAGKHAELLFPKGVNLTHLQKPQPENPKLQQKKDDGKPPKGGGGPAAGGKDQKNPATALPVLQHMKGLKDLKLPQFKDMKLPFQKDPKSVKFALPPEDAEDGSDFDDYDDDYDEDDLDEFDSFDADFDDDFHNLKLKPGNAAPNALNGLPVMPDKKAGACGGGGGGNGKKGGGPVDVPVQIKGMNGNNEAKNGKKGDGNQKSGNGGGGGGGKNSGKGASAGGQDAKNGGSNGKPNLNGNGGKKGGGKNEDNAEAGGSGPFGRPAGFPPGGINPSQLGPMPQMGNMPPAVQGLAAGMAPPGYFAGTGAGMPAVTPEMMAAAAAGGGGGGGNPYQQQYLAALMQQQQRMMMMNGQDRGYPPMMAYPRPPAPPPAMYMPPAHGEPYTNYFSDENANSCSIM